MAIAQHRAQVMQAMVEAAGGVKLPQPATPIPPEIAEARRALSTVFGNERAFELFEGGRFDKVMALVEALGDRDPRELFETVTTLRQSDEDRWGAHGNHVINTLEAEFKKDFIGEGKDGSLSPQQIQGIGNNFVAWIKGDRTLQQRYRMGDTDRLVSEFAAVYRPAFIDPFRRSAEAPTAAAATRRAGLPPAPRGGALPTPAPNTGDKAKTLDELSDNAFEQLFGSAGAAR